MVKTSIEKGIAIVQLNNGKVNTINHALAEELRLSFLSLTKNEAVKGVVLCGHTGAFSAGLDVREMAGNSSDQAHAFWVSYFGALQAMVRYPKPFVCAITGFAPAGGTIFTLCADYRIMAEEPKHFIGMHEFKLSMQIPELMMDLWCYTLGEQKAFQALQEAKLFSAQEALAANIVQAIAPAEQVLDTSIAHLRKCIAVYGPVYMESKRLARKQLLALVDRDLDQLATEFVRFSQDPHLKTLINEFANHLKQK